MTHGGRAHLQAGLLGLGLVQCGSANGDGPTRLATEAIVGGTDGGAVDSPMLYLQGPEGACTAILIAPNLVATARHCVASASPGNFSCTAAGELVVASGNAGQIGSDDPPGNLRFFSSAHVDTRAPTFGSADAIGLQTLSTQSPTACRDDLAFVVLDRTIPGLVPVPIRLDRPTLVGEAVSVWGYGLTDQANAALGLRKRDDAIAGVGPEVASSNTQPAPVRSVRISPVTCQGDSGGAIMSTATGALIALVSLGSQAGTSGPFCKYSELSDTTGPRLSAYRSLALQAFMAAGAVPIGEDPIQDAALRLDVASGPEAATTANESESRSEAAIVPETTNGEESESRPLTTYLITGGSCATGLVGRSRGSSPFGATLTLALAWMAVALGRRRP